MQLLLLRTLLAATALLIMSRTMYAEEFRTSLMKRSNQLGPVVLVNHASTESQPNPLPDVGLAVPAGPAPGSPYQPYGFLWTGFSAVDTYDVYGHRRAANGLQSYQPVPQRRGLFNVAPSWPSAPSVCGEGIGPYSREICGSCDNNSQTGLLNSLLAAPRSNCRCLGVQSGKPCDPSCAECNRRTNGEAGSTRTTTQSPMLDKELSAPVPAVQRGPSERTPIVTVAPAPVVTVDTKQPSTPPDAARPSPSDAARPMPQLDEPPEPDPTVLPGSPRFDVPRNVIPKSLVPENALPPSSRRPMQERTLSAVRKYIRA